MLLWQLCPLSPAAADSPSPSILLSAGRRQGQSYLTVEGQHRAGFSQVFSKSLLSTHFVWGIWLGPFELVMSRVLAPALPELMVWWACPDAELSPPGTCRGSAEYWQIWAQGQVSREEHQAMQVSILNPEGWQNDCNC